MLITDDDPSFVAALRLLLEAGGIAVVATASNGSEAVNRTAETEPDFVIMDFDMPRMNGLTATRMIGRWWPHVSVIVTSGVDEPDVMQRAQRAGAAAFVPKSEIAERLLAVVESAA